MLVPLDTAAPDTCLKPVSATVLALLACWMNWIAISCAKPEAGRFECVNEVMFSVDDEAAAVEIALTLSEAYAADDELSDVRVGMASGPVLQREADLFGPVVNLASRIVGIAFPASVVVSESVHEALADNPNFVWKAIGRRRLKDLGRVNLWVAHRADTAPTPKTPWDEVRATRAERREKTLDRLASARIEHHGLDRSRP